MAIGASGCLWIAMGVYGGLCRPMDTNRWLLAFGWLWIGIGVY